jgi:uroporphyrin-III C-methyltransferase
LTIIAAAHNDAELITIKGAQALASADVMLYDEHVNTELLKHAPTVVKRIFIGKRNGKPGYSQEQVNALIVDLAFSLGHVVHLKGASSYVQDNEYNEVSYAEIFNIESEVIPGVNEQQAIPILVNEAAVTPLLARTFTRHKYLLN